MGRKIEYGTVLAVGLLFLAAALSTGCDLRREFGQEACEIIKLWTSDDDQENLVHSFRYPTTQTSTSFSVTTSGTAASETTTTTVPYELLS